MIEGRCAAGKHRMAPGRAERKGNSDDWHGPGRLMAVLGVLVFAGPAPAADTVFVDERTLSFSSAQRSVWGFDDAAYVLPIDIPVTNIVVPSFSRGGIQSRQVNNPLHDGWQALYDTTYGATYGTVYVASLPGCLGSTSCAASKADSAAKKAASDVAGTEPPKTYAERNGGRVWGDSKFVSGLSGAIRADGGTVSVDYQADVRTTLSGATHTPGAVLSVGTALGADNARIATSGPQVGMSLSTYQDFESHLRMEAYLKNVGGPATLTNFGDGLKTQPLFELTAGNGAVRLDPLGLGPVTVGTELTKQFGATLTPPGSSVKVTVPVFEISAGVPDVAADPAATVREGGGWRNGVAPPERKGTEILGIGNSVVLEGSEFARAALDMDSVSLMLGTPLGISASIGTPPIGIPTILGAEGNALDFDLETYWALRTSYDFVPDLKVTYKFSSPVQIRAADGTLSLAGEVTVPIGEVIDFLNPLDGVDVTTLFSIADNEFRNRTDFELRFGISLAMIELLLGGVLFSGIDAGLSWAEIVDLPNRLAVYSAAAPIGGPIALGRLGSPDGVGFALDGFPLVDGAGFSIMAIPEPGTALLMLAGIAFVLGAAGRRRSAGRPRP